MGVRVERRGRRFDIQVQALQRQGGGSGEPLNQRSSTQIETSDRQAKAGRSRVLDICRLCGERSDSLRHRSGRWGRGGGGKGGGGGGGGAFAIGQNALLFRLRRAARDFCQWWRDRSRG